MEQADQFERSIENPSTTISALVDKCKAVNIEQNRAVLKSIARAVLFYGSQGIALRGDVESVDSSANPGNFLALLKLLALHDEVLRNHLEAPAMWSATQVSLQTQNELITVMGKHIILQGIA